MNFGKSSYKTVEIPGCFWSLGPKTAHPSWNRVKISKFELQKRYVPQKKAESMCNKDSARKNENLCKKRFSFFNFFNFLDTLEDPKKFRCSIFEKFCKRNFINGSSGTSQIVTETKSPILVSLVLLLWKLQTYAWYCGSN